MVDVTEKQMTHRVARARCAIGGLAVPRTDREHLGDELTAARVAAVLGAKATSSVIPLCHPLPLGRTEVEFDVAGDEETIERIEVVVTTVTDSHTGVEMEALCGASLAALSLYRAFMGIGPRPVIGPLELEEKRGGRTGTWRRDNAEGRSARSIGWAP